MSNQKDQDFEKFCSLVSIWKDAYQYAVYSYVAFKTADGPRLLFGRVLLEPTRVGVNETPFTFETEHVIAGRSVTGVVSSNIADIIAMAKRGEMRGPNGILLLAVNKGASFWTHFASIYHPFISEGPRLPSLLIRGVSKHNLLSDTRQLDWELKAADLPFETLDELLGYCGLHTLIQMGDSTTLEIVARSPAMILNTSTITGGETIVECRVAKTLNIKNIKLGYKIFRKELIERGSATGVSFQWRQDNDFQMGSYRFPVGDVSVLQAFLSYSDISLHQWWITDPQKHLNPRHAIHQIFDQDLELIRTMLFRPETDKPYIFEGTVSTLLTLLGFSCANYGRIPKLQKGPDIIAVTPAGHIGVIECTMGLLDENDKLAKLVQRTKLIREQLTAAGYGYLQIQPAIVTPLTQKEVAANLDTAGKHGIAVVCKEDIEELLKQIGLPPNADRLFHDAKRLIPGSNQGGLFQNQAE